MASLPLRARPWMFNSSVNLGCADIIITSCFNKLAMLSASNRFVKKPAPSIRFEIAMNIFASASPPGDR